MTTSARNLHAIIDTLNTTKGANLTSRWQSVLGDDATTVGFGLKYVAVLGLWRDTVSTLMTLPDNPLRRQGLQYASAWLGAILQVDHVWGSNGAPTLLQGHELDVLELVGDQLAGYDNTPPVPIEDDLTALRADCEAWVSVIGEAQLPRGLTVSLVECLERVVWMIDHAEMFGAGPILDAADAAAGRLSRVTVAKRDPSWFKRVVKTLSLITAVSTGIHATDLALTDVNDTFDELQKAIESHMSDGKGDAGSD